MEFWVGIYALQDIFNVFVLGLLSKGACEHTVFGILEKSNHLSACDLFNGFKLRAASHVENLITWNQVSLRTAIFEHSNFIVWAGLLHKFVVLHLWEPISNCKFATVPFFSWLHGRNWSAGWWFFAKNILGVSEYNPLNGSMIDLFEAVWLKINYKCSSELLASISQVCNQSAFLTFGQTLC